MVSRSQSSHSERTVMAATRTASIVLGAVLLVAPAAVAQAFKEYDGKQDYFSASFPGVPTVSNIMWETEYGAKVPGRTYTLTAQGPRTYSVTVIDYRGVQQILTEKAKQCPDQ